MESPPGTSDALARPSLIFAPSRAARPTDGVVILGSKRKLLSPTPSAMQREELSGNSMPRRLIAPDAHRSEEASVRTVADAQGRSWTLFERAVGPASLRRVALLAESHTTLRRFDVYPDQWEDLSDAELLELIHAPVTSLGRISAELQRGWEDKVMARICRGTTSSRLSARPSAAAGLFAAFMGMVPGLWRRAT